MQADATTPCTPSVTGRCYCGATRFRAPDPLTSAYCHCADCKRWTGAPVAAFAAFDKEQITFVPALTDPVEINPGVQRWHCETCRSPIAAWFSYLPDQLYIPLGCFDDPAPYGPELHCYGDRQIPWVHLSDELPRSVDSGADILQKAGS